MSRPWITLLGTLLITAPLTAAEAGPDRAALEKKLSELLTNSVLVGNYTSGPVDGKPLKTEKYTLGEVKKLEGDKWVFPTRIQYGSHDVTLPLVLTIEWAGDTPMISMTKTPVPGLGTFTARVLFYDGQYAGTWSGGDHGGHIFGKIVKQSEAEQAGGAEKKPQK